MARPQKNQMAQRQLATNLKRLRRTKPNATLKDIERWGWARDLDVSRATIQNALHGDVDPTACTVELLILLASFYEVSPAELGAIAEGRINAVLSFARPPDDGPGLDITAPRCKGERAESGQPNRLELVAA